MTRSTSDDRSGPDAPPQKPVPPPMQLVVKGGWTYRIADQIETGIAALKELAQEVRDRSWVFVQDGPRMLSPSEADERKREIVSVADEIDRLAVRVPEGRLSWPDVEQALSKLRKLGHFPDGLLVSNVARAIYNVEQTRARKEVGAEPR